MRRWIAASICTVALGCKAQAPAAPPPDPTPATEQQAVTPTEPGDPGTSPELEGAAEERRQYQAALETARAAGASCKASPETVDVEGLLEAFEVLAPYQQDPERDEAIRTLERCRQLASAYVKENLPEPDAQAREDFSSDLQAAIRKANKRTTKNLSVTVKGSKVTIKHKGRAVKKKEHKKALQGYCAMTSAPTITRITVVTDEHGEMSCSPKFEFSKQPGYVDRRFGIEAPFEVDSTEGRTIPKKK